FAGDRRNAGAGTHPDRHAQTKSSLLPGHLAPSYRAAFRLTNSRAAIAVTNTFPGSIISSGDEASAARPARVESTRSKPMTVISRAPAALAFALAIAGAGAAAAPAHAAPVADFYRGTTINLIVGTSPPTHSHYH